MGRRTGRRGKDDDYETKGIMHWQWLAGLRTGKVLLAYWQPGDGIIGDGPGEKKRFSVQKRSEGKQQQEGKPASAGQTAIAPNRKGEWEKSRENSKKAKRNRVAA